MTSSFWGHWARSWWRTTKTFLSDLKPRTEEKQGLEKLWDNDYQFLSEKENQHTGKITWHQSLFCRDSKLVDCTLWLVPSHSKWRRWVRASADRMKKPLYLKPTCEDDLWAPLLSAWHQRDVVAKRGISWDSWPTSIRDPPVPKDWKLRYLEGIKVIQMTVEKTTCYCQTWLSTTRFQLKEGISAFGKKWGVFLTTCCWTAKGRGLINRRQDLRIFGNFLTENL